MKKKILCWLSLLLIFAGGIFIFFADIHKYNADSYDISLGSANSPAGTTLIISVFADDINYSWYPNESNTSTKKEEIRSYLKIATDYLSDEAEKYNVNADFIFDFDTHSDLAYYATFPVDTTDSDSQYAESSMNDFIATQIPVDKLRQKYRADNIVYFMFVNTDEYSDSYSCTRNYYEGMEYPYEIVFMYYMDSGLVNCPAVYAHEILHTFGAPDLYCADSEYAITDDFVEYIRTNMPNDIMFYCSDITSGEYVYDRITNELSPLDAYYIGLTQNCSLADEYKLGRSQH